MGDPARRARRSERGTGLLGSVFGVGIVLALVGLASNVLLGLWVRSTVDSVAYDAARRVATAPLDAGPDVGASALSDARRALGRYGERVSLRFEHPPGADLVVLHVRSPGVALLPRLLGGGPTVGDLDRRIVLLRERA